MPASSTKKPAVPSSSVQIRQKTEQPRYKVPPITDRDKIDQLFSRASGSDGFFTHVACKPATNKKTDTAMPLLIAPYCTPSMYYVCYICGIVSQSGRQVEKHIKFEHIDSTKLKTERKDKNKCIPRNLYKNNVNNQNSSSKPKPTFGWFKGERYLVIGKYCYAYSCVCGTACDTLRSLQEHFKQCPDSKNTIFQDNISNFTDLGGIEPKRLVNDKEHQVKCNKYSCGFTERRNEDLEFCYNIPRKEMLIGQYTTTQEGRRYLIINRYREIDRIIKKLGGDSEVGGFKI
jgi:hypothetical protein